MKVFEMGGNQLPVRRLGEKGINMAVCGVFIRTVECHIIPGSHTGHEFDTQQVSQPKDRL